MVPYDPRKAATGIAGLDDITRGGLPRNRVTLLAGGAGSGKSILALQTLVNAARDYDELGIFVAFEEDPEQIIANAKTFGWDLSDLVQTRLFFIDARPNADLVASGNCDLHGMLAALEAKVAETGAKRIVMDALDVVLAFQTDPKALRREIYRTHDWLNGHALTALITAKMAIENATGEDRNLVNLLQFMVDCVIVTGHDVIDGISQRNLRITKYRGSSFEENQVPFLFGPHGVEIASMREREDIGHPASNERISTGIERLDSMLRGGYYRGASILITGSPGTAKTTLCGAFAQAACRRGEPTLFVSFDSRNDEIIRNLAAVNIRLDEFAANGLLRLVSGRAADGCAEMHLLQIKNMAQELGARNLIIDPLSALGKSGNEAFSHDVAERLIYWAKARGATVLCTSLLSGSQPQAEQTSIAISTIADTWMHLTYQVQAGERNRGLTIVKSRGTGHSNQMRELLLSDGGVTLADVYTAGGEVLMGTLRWEKERALRLAEDERVANVDRLRVKLQAEVVNLEGQISSLRNELESKLDEQARLTRHESETINESAHAEVIMQQKRLGER